MHGSDYDPGGLDGHVSSQVAIASLETAASAPAQSRPDALLLPDDGRSDHACELATTEHAELVRAFQAAGAALANQAGRQALVRAMLTIVPLREFITHAEAICGELFGAEPLMVDGTARLESSWESRQPAAGGHGMLALRHHRSDVAAGDAFRYIRCWACEPYMGTVEDRCTALQTLQEMAVELEEQVRNVAEEEQYGGSLCDARRSARYTLYRKFVYVRWGYLGSGKRVRIPACVVEFIRDKFREPGCTCLKGGPLYNCRTHGYTGHRDAP